MNSLIILNLVSSEIYLAILMSSLIIFFVISACPDFYFKVTQIVPEIKCFYVCPQCTRNRNITHCDELRSNIADRFNVGTEISYDLNGRGALLTNIKMRKI